MAIVAAVALMFHVKHGGKMINYWICYNDVMFWGSYVAIMENPLTILNVVLSEYAHYNPYC